MIKNEVTITKELVKELSRKIFVLSLVIGIVGVCSSIPFLVLLILNPTHIYFVVLFIGLLSVGGIGFAQFIRVLITNKRAVSTNAHLINELYDDKLIIHTKENGNKVEDITISYDQISTFNISKNYIFIRIGKKYFFPLSRDENEEAIVKLLEDNGVIKK